MSERAYLMSRIVKGLPSALRALPKDATMHNPYVATRVIAHDRGKDAAYMMAKTKKYAAKMDQTRPRPTKGLLLRNPPKAAYRAINRHYVDQGLRTSGQFDASVRNQGRKWRAASREHLAAPEGRLIRLKSRRQFAEAA